MTAFLIRYLPLAAIVLASCSVKPMLGGKQSAPGSIRCSYVRHPANTQQLLHKIDQELPRAIGTTQQALRPVEREAMPTIVLDSCFVEFSLTKAFSVLMFERPATTDAALHRQLRHGYYKTIGEYNSIEVLEYATSEAAMAAKMIQDSLVATCRGRNSRLEPCAGIDLYRVTQHSACLVRYNVHNTDPIQLSILHQVGANLAQLL